MKEKCKIAVIQYQSRAGCPEENTRLGVRLMEKAKEQGADLVLFPECWITGYAFPEFDDEIPVKEIEKNRSVSGVGRVHHYRGFCFFRCLSKKS